MCESSSVGTVPLKVKQDHVRNQLRPFHAWQTPHDTVSPSGKVTGVVGKLIVDGEEVHQLHFHIR